jgi:TetR/AcrR family tetracycline transcriptional repressor
MTEPARPRRRPRRPLLTHEAVLEAAARVLERDGYAGLTMRAIGDELGVQAPALYWYFPNKDALEIQLYDHLMAGFQFRLTGDDWGDHIRQAARQLRQHLRGTRDIARLVPFNRASATGPTTLAQFDGALAILLAGGLSPRDAAYAFSLLFAYVVNWAAADADHRAAHTGAAHTSAASPDFDPHRFPTLAALAPHLTSLDPDGRFEFGLDCMITGLQARAAKR